MHSIFKQIVPFLFLGIMVVLAIVGFVLFSYLLIFGALVGIVLFVVTWITGLFTGKKGKHSQQMQHKKGRTIDHDHL